MAYDEQLAARLRALFIDDLRVTEQPMFGGLSFLVDGNLAVAASSWGGLLVRVGVEAAAELETSTTASRPEMGTRTMKGWLHVDGPDVESDHDLQAWVDRAFTFVRELPPK